MGGMREWKLPQICTDFHSLALLVELLSGRRTCLTAQFLKLALGDDAHSMEAKMAQ